MTGDWTEGIGAGALPWAEEAGAEAPVVTEVCASAPNATSENTAARHNAAPNFTLISQSPLQPTVSAAFFGLEYSPKAAPYRRENEEIRDGK